MPKVTQVPRNVEPYLFHGVDVDWREGSEQATADCPFCGKEKKFCLNLRTGLWQCKVCQTGSNKGGGNEKTFLRLLWERSDEATNGRHKELSDNRKLLYPETLMRWEVVYSILTKDWLVPGYSLDRKLQQLYRYMKDFKGKMRLLPTKGITHHLHGLNLFDPKKPDVYICEGPWDAMALWETMKSAKRSADGECSITANESISMLSSANVIAVPGCNVFHEYWTPLLADKRVFLMYDSDHPRVHEGTTIEPVGYSGMKRVAQMLGRAEQKPKDVSFINWGEHGYDKSLPSGYDVRDALTKKENPSSRVESLSQILSRIVPIPEDWISGRSTRSVQNGSTDLECTLCEEWDSLINAWRKAMRWSEGLDRGLSVMLSCILSTKCVGDQLWCKIIGPPACGKSTLCEALSINKKYILAKSTIRGFHSGFKTDRDGTEDNSLVHAAKDKTLITKDGDTLLKAPNFLQIMSEGRDIYDRTSRTHYRHGLARDYENHSMTWLLCGTESLREMDGSELGERFLDTVIVDKIDEAEERETALKVAYRAEREMSLVSGSSHDMRDGPELVLAKQLTGGYVSYLRENAQTLLDQVESSDAAISRCVDLGTFVAYMRSRPSKKQDEKIQREMSYRLVSQMVRLGKCLAVVLNRRILDDEVMRRVSMVALDTARGRTLEIARHLFSTGLRGSSIAALSIATGHTEDKERQMLRFLKSIGVAEYFTPNSKKGILAKPRWRLTSTLRSLYGEVLNNVSGHKSNSSR